METSFNGANPYYNPDKCGLEIFDEIDTAGSYEFDTFVIWKKIDDGKLYYASDSGCSCPTPFESFYGLDELNSITEENFHGFDEALKNHSRIEDQDYIAMKTRVKSYLNETKS